MLKWEVEAVAQAWAEIPEDVWSYRHRQDNEPFADAINEGARRIQSDFPDLMEETIRTVEAAEFGGKDKLETLGCYGQGSLFMNTNYTNPDKMNKVYDNSLGFHPSRGNLTGTEAVTLHELGHALTEHVGRKMGMPLYDIDKTARKIFTDAYHEAKQKGKYQDWAGTISDYAKKFYAEAVAEAVSDYYCNGNNAAPASKAIMKQLFKYR